MDIKVASKMCATCPFRPDGLTEVRSILEETVLTGRGSPYCHQTQDNSEALCGKPKSGPLALCRGARNYANNLFHRLGLLSAPTDEAWDEKWEEVKARNEL